MSVVCPGEKAAGCCTGSVWWMRPGRGLDLARMDKHNYVTWLKLVLYWFYRNWVSRRLRVTGNGKGITSKLVLWFKSLEIYELCFGFSSLLNYYLLWQNYTRRNVDELILELWLMRNQLQSIIPFGLPQPIDWPTWVEQECKIWHSTRAKKLVMFPLWVSKSFLRYTMFYHYECMLPLKLLMAGTLSNL